MCHAEIRSASIINSRWTEVTKQTSVISWDNDCDFLLKSKAQQKMEGVLLYKGSAVLLRRNSLNDKTCCCDCSDWFATPESKLEIIQLNKMSLHVEQLVWTLFLIQIFLLFPHPFSFAVSFALSLSASCVSTAVSEGHGVDMSCSESQAT